MFYIILLLFVICLILSIVYIKLKKVDLWLIAYLKQVFIRCDIKDKPVDILFLFVDHFELNGHQDRLEAWDKGYPQLAGQHTDADGCHPKHSFFYAMDLMHEHELEKLQHLVDEGFGEFELHWHHHHETAATVEAKINAAMLVFHKYNYMKPYKQGQSSCFAFIHGNWSLANSRGADYCGVDNEIEILQELGCYGDFTFPALFNEAQPAIINSIYYSSDNHQRKAYAKGRLTEVGKPASKNEFLNFQGPLTINWKDWRYGWHPQFEDGDINMQSTHGDPKRIDAWVRQAIHVKGRPEWQFVKVFCHGAQDHKAVVSNDTDRMFAYLESKYNDGGNYRLHYVTAREAYNIVRAAEDGKYGNPNDYRDYEIPHPLNR